MQPILDKSMFRPADSPMTVDEIVSATLVTAAQAREAYKLAADRFLVVTVPYDPARRDSWINAETAMSTEPAGKFIKFDWSLWNVWTINRGDDVGGVPPEWLVKPGDGKAIVPSWVIEPLGPVRLRELAAGAMAMAEFLEASLTEHLQIEGGL